MASFLSTSNSGSMHSLGSQGVSYPPLTRSDFKRIDIKGMAGRYYFSFKQHPVEITLEPCLNGFDIGFYKGEDMGTVDKKTCTNVTFPIYLEDEKTYKEGLKDKKTHIRTMTLDMFSTQERSNLVWDKALALANEKLRVYRADQQLKKWKMFEKDEDEIYDKPNPIPNPPYYNPGSGIVPVPYSLSLPQGVPSIPSNPNKAILDTTWEALSQYKLGQLKNSQDNPGSPPASTGT